MEVLKRRREPPRAYSMASAPHEPLAITIKEETWVPGQEKYPPLLSPFLVHEVQPGMAMTVAGFTGPYHLPVAIEKGTDHIVHLCAGSGSVPNWSMLKGALRDHPRLRHTFAYENETWDDIIYRDALNALAAANAGRLCVVHMLTDQKDSSALPSMVRRGRINADLIRGMGLDFASAMFYACGPALTPWVRLAARERGVEPAPRFIERIRGMVNELGIPSERFKEESYG
jgi:3-ketosteroid 9alpha-monooxygenase subunit B